MTSWSHAGPFHAKSPLPHRHHQNSYLEHSLPLFHRHQCTHSLRQGSTAHQGLAIFLQNCSSIVLYSFTYRERIFKSNQRFWVSHVRHKICWQANAANAKCSASFVLSLCWKKKLLYSSLLESPDNSYRSSHNKIYSDALEVFIHRCEFSFQQYSQCSSR